MKKKGGTLAGLPRASGERNSPTGGMNGQVSQVVYSILLYSGTVDSQNSFISLS